MGCSDVNVWHSYIFRIFFSLLLLAPNASPRRCSTGEENRCTLLLSKSELLNIHKCYENPPIPVCYDLMCKTKDIGTNHVNINMTCYYLNRMYSPQPCCIKIHNKDGCYMIRLQYGKKINGSAPFFPATCDSPLTGSSDTATTATTAITSSSTDIPMSQQEAAANALQDDGNSNISPGQPSGKEPVDDSETLSALSIGVIVAGVVVCSSIIIGFVVWKRNQNRLQEPGLLFSRSPNGRQPEKNGGGGINAWKAPASTYDAPDLRQSSDGGASYDTPPKHSSMPDETQEQSVYTAIDNESCTAPPGYSTFTRPEKTSPNNGSTNHDYSKLGDPIPSASFDEIVKERKAHTPAKADQVNQNAVKTTDLCDADPSCDQHYIVLEDEENPHLKTTPDQDYFELEKDGKASPQARLGDNDYFQLEMEPDVQTAHQVDDDTAENRKDMLYFEIEKEDTDSKCCGENETNDKIKAKADISGGSADQQTATYVELEKEESTESAGEALYQLATAIPD